MFLLLPTGSSRKPDSLPLLTFSLIGLNAAIFFFTILGPDFEAVVRSYGVRPGAWSIQALFTHMFLHGSLFHLAGNMMFLYVFGSALEGELGRLRFTAAYLLFGASAAVMHAWQVRHFLPSDALVPCIGASGAISGILGVYLVRFARSKVDMAYFFWLLGWISTGTFTVPARFMLACWLGTDLIFGLLDIAYGSGGGVAHWAHLGGFAAGYLTARAAGFARLAAREGLMEEMQLHLISRNWAAALEVCDRRELLEGPDAWLHETRGLCWQQLGRAQKAAVHYGAALPLLMRTGTSGEVSRCFESWRAAAAIGQQIPLPASALLELGGQLEAAGFDRQSLEVYSEASGRLRTSSQARKADLRRAEVLLRLGEAGSAAVLVESLEQQGLEPMWQTAIARLRRRLPRGPAAGRRPLPMAA